MLHDGFDRTAERKMKKEFKTYRKNELLKDKLLIAREKETMIKTVLQWQRPLFRHP